MRPTLGIVFATLLGCGSSRDGPSTGVLDASDAIDFDAAADASDSDADAGPSYVPLAWSTVEANILSGNVISLWGTSRTDVYVGTDANAVYRLVNGSPERTLLGSQVAGGGWGVDPLHVYAAGASAWLAQEGTASSGGIFRYDTESAWDPIPSDATYAVWGSSTTDVYAAGPGGIFHAIDGATFQAETTGGSNALSIWGSGATDVFATAAGDAGAVLHSAGDGQWSSMIAQVTGLPWAGWSSGPGDAYVVVSPVSPDDPDAVVLHSDADGGWAVESTGEPGAVLVAIWGSGPADVYAAGWHAGPDGRAGDLYHSSGDGRWTRLPLPGAFYEITCVWGSGADDVYVGGFDVDDGPTILHGVR